jgi:exopolysaccharide/PEP-CTERM locus tyrosine autokinase
MNEHTPRRFKGTLVERAAEFYHYGEPAPVARMPEPPAAPIAPVRVSAPVRESAPVFEEFVAPPAPQIRPAPEPEPVAVEAPPPEVAAAPAHPVASIVPTGRRHAQIDRAVLADGGMLVPGGPVTALAEEFRLVKRQLLTTSRVVSAVNEDRARMILVCSAKPDDGKTFCAINLALSMAAEKDVEILLVDADFAKPDILARLGIEQGPGLLDALSGAVANVEDCILDTDIPHLAVLPAGTRTHSDTELLASARANAILDGLAAANKRRIVIFDSPPVLAASPASVLAAHVGQVMLVVRADRTGERDLREAVAMLDGCENIQLVLNSVSFTPGGRRFGSYYGQEDSK